MADNRERGAGGGGKESRCPHCGVTLVDGKPVIEARKKGGSYIPWIVVAVSLVFVGWMVTPSPEQKTVATGMSAGRGADGGAEMTGELPEGHPPIDEMQGGMPEDVMEQLTELKQRVAQNPQDSEALKNLGNMYYDISNYDTAIKYYSDYLTIVPDDPMVETDLGAMYFAKGEVDHAEEHFLKAIELDDTLYQAYVNLALVMDVKGEYDEAIRQCEIAKELVDDPSVKEGIEAIIDEFEKHKLEDIDE